MPKKVDKRTRRLLRDPSGQLAMFEKSYEEELEEARNQPVECLGITFANDEARRAYFLEKLREKLHDPAFRAIEGFPIGTDEDILALSNPPYYTACPNPFLEAFVRHYGRPYDPATDHYRREPFAADVSEGKNEPIYSAHSYHTKVPHKAIMRYILHYTEPGDVVLDGFCGSGMTGVAAQACGAPDSDFRASIETEFPSTKWGARRAILVDLSPAATFIASNHNAKPQVESFLVSAKRALDVVQSRLGWLYKTSLDGRQAVIYHTVWSDVFICPECSGELVFWDTAVDSLSGSISDALRCPSCGASTHKRQLSRKVETVLNPDTGELVTRAEQRPVLLRCQEGRQRRDKTVDEQDLEVVARSEREPVRYWYPSDRIDRDIDLWYERDYRSLGIRSVDGFYTRRNLRALGALWEWASSTTEYSNRAALLFALTGMQVNLSRMNRWRHNVSFPYNPLSGTLYVGSLPVESNVFIGVANKVSRLGRIWSGYSLGEGYALSTGSATALRGVSDDSVDYVFTDPPFGSNIIYSDLSIIWESWLRLKTDTSSEAVVHRRKKRGASTLATYGQAMSRCFSEMHRVLKPGRWMTVEFHNTRNSVWSAIQEALFRSGFVVADVRVLDKHLCSFKQVTAAGAVKQDLVISAYKPNGGLEDRFRLEAGTEDGAWDFTRTHLRQLPVFVAKEGRVEVIAERQSYLLYDRMVAFHVQRGITVPLSAAEFYAGLAQRFPERDGMFFLPDQAAEYDQKRLTVREVEQLQLIVTDESSAIQWLKQQLEHRPQTFQELHPQFLREIGGWSRNEMPLELSTLLEQSFLRYDGTGEVPSQVRRYLVSTFQELRDLPKDDPSLRVRGKDRWYVPDPNVAGDLEKLRERALLREYDEYVASAQRRLRVFRLEAVRAGFKRAWQARDYAMIIAVADKIPEAVLQEDPKLLMWFDQAVTRTGREP